MYHRHLLAAAFGAAIALFATGALAQQDVIEKRQKLMKQQSADAKAIKAAVEAKDYATVQTKAKDLMATSEQIPELFPKGSTKGKTKAKAEIWENWDDFTKHAKSLRKAASELAEAAKGTDHAAVEAKVKAVSGACGSCHKAFRAEKYSE
jgi:cytochrome c556